MPAGNIAAFAPLIPAALAWAACSSAEIGEPGGSGGEDGGNGGGALVDAGGGGPTPDAAPSAPDAGIITLSQSASEDIIGFNSVACFNKAEVETINSFYRVFDLASEGITGPFDITKVKVGVEVSTSGSAGLTATLLLHTLGGQFDPGQAAFNLADLSQLKNVETVIPDVAFPGEGEIGGILHDVPIQTTAPAGSRLVVEVAHGGLNPGQELILGSNQEPQEGFTYWRAPDCDLNNPTNVDTQLDVSGEPITMHWVVLVEGTTGG